MGRTLSDSWDGDFDVRFGAWGGDTIVELYYPSGDRELCCEEEEMIGDLRSETDGAVFSALESGLWVVAQERCFGVFNSLPGRRDTRVLHATCLTREEAERILAVTQDRRAALGLKAGTFEWTVEPMPVAGGRGGDGTSS